MGVRNNNKRKESTRLREVCSNCQIFLAKQVHFHLASRLSKFRVKQEIEKLVRNWKMDNRKDAETGSGWLARTGSGFRWEQEFRKLAGSQEPAGFGVTGPTGAPV